MKIGKLTLDGYYNYGNVLQNYALNKVLERYGEVETIWHDHGEDLTITHFNWPKPWLWNPFKIVRNPQRYVTEIRRTPLEASRQAIFKSFCDRYIRIRYNADLSKIADEYDYFVVGSDQVWNSDIIKNDELYKAKFLTFARPEQRISYAASIASPTVPENRKQIFIDGIRGMKTLSLREEAGAKLVYDLTGREASVNLDPTLLLTAEEWRQIARRPTWLSDEPYLLTYYLSPAPAAVDTVATRLKLRTIKILDPTNYDHYVIAPEEWLYLFDHATLVYTDSFHGAAFSILFRRPFVVSDRMGRGAFRVMSSRIDTLLALSGLDGRRGTEENGFIPPAPLFSELPDPDEILLQGRTQAVEYLERAFELR